MHREKESKLLKLVTVENAKDQLNVMSKLNYGM
jgi:hypothetical protein